MPEDACKAMSELAYKTKVWIAKQDAVGEESITDWLLFEASERLPNLYYRKSSKIVEGRETGADWEWWFVGKRESLALRVQAKRLRDHTDNYGSIAYANRHGMQIEKLVTSAMHENFIPVYCFYATAYREEAPICRWERVTADPEPYRFSGIYISGAVSIYDKLISPGRRKLFIPDILRLSVPLPCIFCCPVATEGQSYLSVKGLHNFLGRHFRRTLESMRLSSFLGAGRGGGPTPTNPGIHNRVPGYVRDLLPPLEMEFALRIPTNETTEATPGSSAVVVVDMRQPMPAACGPPDCGDPQRDGTWQASNEG